MRKQCIVSPNGPPAVGPYSAAVRTGNLLFISGQGSLARDGSGYMAGSMEEESRNALENLKIVLADAGLTLDDVVKTTVYLLDMMNFTAFNEVYKEYFSRDCPARTCIQAAGLPQGMQVEIEAIAVFPEE